MLQSVATPPAQVELQLDTSAAIEVSSVLSSASLRCTPTNWRTSSGLRRYPRVLERTTRGASYGRYPHTGRLHACRGRTTRLRLPTQIQKQRRGKGRRDRSRHCGGLHRVLHAAVCLPAIVLANIGGVIALVDHAHGWVTWTAIAAVAGAWIWIGRQILTTRTRPTISTLAMMAVATVVIALAAPWPQLKPTVFHSLGITKNMLDKG
jgi:hypothetical protein